MAGRIKEGDGACMPFAICVFYFVRRNTLGDAARLIGNNVGLANVVKERRFAMINMPHDDNNGSPMDQVVFFLWHMRFLYILALHFDRLSCLKNSCFLFV